MKYAFLIARREFIENAKTKGFWIGISIFPILLFLMIQAPVWLEEKATPIRYFILVDQSGALSNAVASGLEKSFQQRVLQALGEYARENSTLATNAAAVKTALKEFSKINAANPDLVDKLASKEGNKLLLEQLKPYLKPNAPPFKEPRRRFELVKLPAGLNADGDIASLSQELKPYLRGEKRIQANGQSVGLHAAILIPRDIEKQIVRPRGGSITAPASSKGIEYWSVNVADTGHNLREQIEEIINTEIRRKEFLARGLDAAAIREVQETYAPFASLNPKKEAGKEKVNTADQIKQWAPSGFVYLLWMAIFMIVQMLLTNIIEEKSNRIIEVLLSSVTPGELMMGKLCGIAAVGLTMVGTWMAALFFVLSWKSGGTSEVAGQLLTVLKTSNLLPVFSIYFILGYVMYAAVILSLGSVCNTLKEAQSYMSVITVAMMVPLLTMTFIPKDPNGALARVLSWIPIYTPFTMMNRATSDPPLIDLIGTMVLLIVTTGAALWMSGKIFRIGILRTGQPPKILEMIRWVRTRD